MRWHCDERHARPSWQPPAKNSISSHPGRSVKAPPMHLSRNGELHLRRPCARWRDRAARRRRRRTALRGVGCAPRRPSSGSAARGAEQASEGQVQGGRSARHGSSRLLLLHGGHGRRTGKRRALARRQCQGFSVRRRADPEARGPGEQRTCPDARVPPAPAARWIDPGRRRFRVEQVQVIVWQLPHLRSWKRRIGSWPMTGQRQTLAR